MVPEAHRLAKVELQLGLLFLDNSLPESGVLKKAPADWVVEWLELQPLDHFGIDHLRHLVAVQFAPCDAVLYDRTNPTPRWRIVDDYLATRFDLDVDDRRKLARLVATILDYADSDRGPKMLATDLASTCAICRLPFRVEPTSVRTRDPFKPVWKSGAELCRPEVDHIVPIVGLGEHRVDNLQVVCRACNLAKGSGLVVDPAAEIRFAGEDLGDVARVHLFRLLQWLIIHRGAYCECCGTQVGELTMRPVHPDATLTRSNLKLACYACAESMRG